MKLKILYTLDQHKLVTATALIAFTFFPALSKAQDGAELYISKACIACHGSEGRAPTNEEIPVIAGQNHNYLVNQITDIKSGARNSGNAVQMKGIAQTLTDDEIELISSYLSSQKVTFAE